MAKLSPAAEERLGALESAINDYTPAFQKLRGAPNLAAYLATRGERADEEILTEPILRSVIERVLGFPKGRYLEQLGKSGRKPDFTPEDLIAHPFVLEAKASDEVMTLLLAGRELVEQVERLVCAIYDVPDDLTEQVVAHAVRRAG